MKYRAKVICEFAIEIEEDTNDLGLVKENIEMSKIQDLLENQIENSIEFVKATNLKMV